MTALEAVLRRRSRSSVTAEAPSRLALLPLVEAAATVADHGDLKPWRLIELRGEGGRGRPNPVLLTAAGKAALEAVWPQFMEANSPAALGLSQAEAASLNKVLHHLRTL